MDFRFLRKSGHADITAMTEIDSQPPTSKGAPMDNGRPFQSTRQPTLAQMNKSLLALSKKCTL
jgi:hypothetical protein